MQNESIINKTSFSYSYSMLDCINKDPDVPSNSYFSRCLYYDYINNHVVLNGVMETFSLSKND